MIQCQTSYLTGHNDNIFQNPLHITYIGTYSVRLIIVKLTTTLYKIIQTDDEALTKNLNVKSATFMPYIQLCNVIHCFSSSRIENSDKDKLLNNI